MSINICCVKCEREFFLDLDECFCPECEIGLPNSYKEENTHMRNALKDIKAAIRTDSTGAPVSMCVATVWALVNGGLEG